MKIKIHSVFLSILCSGFLLGQDVFAYKSIDEKPIFPGCETQTEQESLNHCNNRVVQYEIMRYIQYPESSIDKGETGMCFIKFIVTEEGKIENAEISRSTTYAALDKAALEAVSLIFKGKSIIPGQKDGKPVNVSYVVPVKFKLDIEKPVEKSVTVKTDDGLSTDEILDRLEHLKSPDFESEDIRIFSDQYIRFVKGIITGFYLKDRQVINDWELFFKEHKLDEGPNPSMLSKSDEENLNHLFEKIRNIKRSIH